MGDSFVDVTYRGLEVGRRLRIRDFTSDAAYVEAPTPMPVGSQLDLSIDGGVHLAVVVARVHEQVGGSDRPPGMQVRAALEGAARGWWAERVIDSPAPPEPAQAPRMTRAVSPPVPAAVVHEETAPASMESGPVAADDASTTQVMAVVDPDADALEDDRGGNGEVVDDGKRTQVMATVDIDAIMAQATAAQSGPVATGDDDEEPEIELSGGGDADEDVSQDGPATGGNGTPGTGVKKKRGARRRKKK